MDLGIRDRVAVVAAASRGIGFAVARRLASEGAKVYICSRDAARIAEAASRIADQTGAPVTGIRADVTSDGDLKSFISEASSATGRIDICVTNAGGPPATIFSETEIDQYRQAFELNALSAIKLARLVVPGMRLEKWGRIINITSVSVKQPIDGLLLSNTVRAGLTGWAKTLSNELAPFNVTVNNVAPGYTLTERQKELAEARGRLLGKKPDDLVKDWASQIPMGRLANPDEIAAAVAFLASEHASYITGVTLAVDGGWVRSLF